MHDWAFHVAGVLLGIALAGMTANAALGNVIFDFSVHSRPLEKLPGSP